MANAKTLRWRGIELSLDESGATPDHSPHWRGTRGNLRVTLAQNTQTGVYTAMVGVNRASASAENLDHRAALRDAFQNLHAFATDPANASSRRAQTLAKEDLDEVSAIRAASD